MSIPRVYRKIVNTGGKSGKMKNNGGLSDFQGLTFRGFTPSYLYHQITAVWCILVDKTPICGPTLMTRGCFGALRLAAARLILLHACSVTVWSLHSWVANSLRSDWQQDDAHSQAFYLLPVLVPIKARACDITAWESLVCQERRCDVVYLCRKLVII